MPRSKKKRNQHFPPKVSVLNQDEEIILEDEDDFVHSLKVRFPELDSWVIRLVWDETKPQQVNTIIKLSSIASAAAEQKTKLQLRKPPILIHRASAPVTRINSPTEITRLQPRWPETPESAPPHSARPTKERFYSQTPPLKPISVPNRSQSVRSAYSEELTPQSNGQLPPPLSLHGATEPPWSYKDQACRGNANKLSKDVKLCKYFLAGRCKKDDNCEYSHDIGCCEYISLRKMNMKAEQLERALEILDDNEQIWFLNVGRNRVGSKMAAMIARVLALPQLRRLSMDSSAIGRAGMLSIIDAACESTSLEYLDLSDVECCRSIHSTMSVEERRFAQMKREEIVNAIIALLNSTAPIKHLYIGHNGFTFREIKKICSASNSCMITLDVHGNNITAEQLEWVHNTIYNMRYTKTYNALLTYFKHDHEDIVAVICEFCHSDKEANYRCIDWKPKRRRSISKERKNVYAELEESVSPPNDYIDGDFEDLFGGRRKHGKRGSRYGRKNGQWNMR